MIASERLYRAADGRVVREGDPAAAFLLCIPGEEIPADTVPEPVAVKADVEHEDKQDVEHEDKAAPAKAPARKAAAKK